MTTTAHSGFVVRSEGHNLYRRLRDEFAADDRVFIECTDGTAIMYSDIDARTQRLQAALSGLGVSSGDRVLALIEKSATSVMLYLACLRMGAIWVPLNPAYTDSEVAAFIEDAEPAVVVCDPQRVSGLEVSADASGAALATLDAAGGGTLEQAAIGDGGGDVVAVAPDDIAAILYTSGTTGRSKGAMLTHHNLASNAAALYDVWGFHSRDVLLHALPLYHAHGLFVALHTAMLGGCSVIMLPRFRADSVVQQLPRSTVFMAVPTYYARLLGVGHFDADACRNIRLFTSGSAPLLPDVWRSVKTRTGHEIVERYGMSEALMITSNPYADGERVPGSVGFALPEVELRVTDATGSPLQAGAIGMLEVRGPSVFAGYWGAPEATSRAMTPDGFLKTGDLASLDPSRRVFLAGRAKDLVITGGLNVFPGEVEAVIDGVEGVVESAVVGVPHADYGEAVTAVVVIHPGTVCRADIDSALEGALAGFKHPKYVVVADELPRNAMGKVQKAALRRRLAGLPSGNTQAGDLRFLS